MQTLASMRVSAVEHLCRLSNVTSRETVELSPGGVLMLTWNLLEHFEHQPRCPDPSAHSRCPIQGGTCPRGPGVYHAAALQLRNARRHHDRRTSAAGSAHTRGAWDPGLSTERHRSCIITQTRSLLNVSTFPSEQKMGPNA